jgi:S-formylglutathione hydrolase
MGGHGALTIALKNVDKYQSVSAFSPITNPMKCPWGQKAFTAYLGRNTESWKAYDSCELMKEAKATLPMLIDQGTSDDFLKEQLKPEALSQVAVDMGYPLELRYHNGYDHSYYFMASFIEDHLKFHAKYLT